MKKKTCDVDGGGGVAEDQVDHTDESQDQLSPKRGEHVFNTLSLRKNHQTQSDGVVDGCGGNDDGHGRDETIVFLVGRGRGSGG